MTAQAMMSGADGAPVKCYRRAARNVTTGDWLPDHGGTVAGDPVTDPDDGRIWVTLTDGRDVPFTPRGKVWMHRTYRLAGWQAEAVESYRAARDAREALRESGDACPTSVPGASGSAASYAQLERSDFDTAVPAPRLSEFLREAADARREHA